MHCGKTLENDLYATRTAHLSLADSWNPTSRDPCKIWGVIYVFKYYIISKPKSLNLTAWVLSLSKVRSSWQEETHQKSKGVRTQRSYWIVGILDFKHAHPNCTCRLPGRDPSSPVWGLDEPKVNPSLSTYKCSIYPSSSKHHCVDFPTWILCL